MNKKGFSPTFSVIIPTHNRARLISRAIRSVLSQTFQDFELLIVDDVSTDATKEVVASFRDKRIIYIRREDNGGAAAARNTGIRYAKGKYISLLDDDDEYLPEFLEKMNQKFESSPQGVGFGWCGVRWVSDTSDGEKEMRREGIWQPKFENREHAYLSFLRSRRVGTNYGLTIRKSCFGVVGFFDESMKKAEDTDFLIRMVRQFDFCVVPSVLVKVHRHAGPRLTTYDAKMANSYERIIEKNNEALLKHPRLSAVLHYKTGWLYYHAGNKKHGRQFMLRAIRMNPAELKIWLGLLIFECFGSLGPSLHKRLSTYKTLSVSQAE